MSESRVSLWQDIVSYKEAYAQGESSLSSLIFNSLFISLRESGKILQLPMLSQCKRGTWRQTSRTTPAGT